ncbi:MAG: hypothetical protein JO250_13195 [Armatimonadetes bacterium]|nr:hypothetical protein [Armatimonadota bacterium]
MSIPNAKICPRCGKVVPLSLGVCDHCARLFRTPFDEAVTENRTMMFYHLPFPPAAPPARRRALWRRAVWQNATRRLRQIAGTIAMSGAKRMAVIDEGLLGRHRRRRGHRRARGTGTTALP